MARAKLSYGAGGEPEAVRGGDLPVGASEEAGPGDAGHEELAAFQLAEQEVLALMGRCERAMQGRGPRARRLALLGTKLEEAWLQAKQGVHEARYGQ